MDRNCKADKAPFPEAGTEALQTNYPQPVSFTVDEVRYHVIPDRHRKQVAIDGTTDMKVRELAIPPTVCHGDTDYAVTTISPLAFARLSRLRIIQLPDSIEEIGRHAFFACTQLKRLFIPASTVSIGVRAFACCEKLTDIQVDRGNLIYLSDEGLLYGNGGKTLLCCPSRRQGHYAIPDGVTTLADSAMAGCEQLTAITLPASIVTIGECAFFQCHRLTSITCLTVVPPPISFSEMIEVNRVMCTVHVPKAAVDSYRAAEVWNEFAIMGDADDYPEF